MLKRFIFLSAFLIYFSALVYPFSISIDPPSLYLNGKVGGPLSNKITVQNTSDQDITVKVYYQDWTYAPDQTKAFSEPRKSRFSMAPYLKLYAESLALKPSEKQDVYFDLKPSQNVSGGLYGVVFFETNFLNSEPRITNNQVRLVGRLGTILYYTPEGAKSDLTIEADASIASETPSVNVSLTNTGTLHLSLKGSILLLDSKTRAVIDRVPVESVRLLPGDRVVLSRRFTAKLSPGIYTLLGTFQTIDSQAKVFVKPFAVTVR